MDKLITVAGIALIVIGLIAPLPQSAVGTTSSFDAAVSVSCSSSGVCILTATIDNPYSTYPASTIGVDIGVAQFQPTAPTRCGGQVGFVYCNSYSEVVDIGSSVTITQDLSKGNVYTGNNWVPGNTYYVVVCGGDLFNADYQNCVIYNLGYSFVYPSTATSTSSTTTAAGTFTIQYPLGAGFSVSPSGTNVQTCTSSSCGNLASYSAVWPPGTALSVTVIVPAGYAGCWQYAGLSGCTSFVSGQPFTITTQTGNPFAVIFFQATNTQAVTINACVSAPNPCASSGPTGSWDRSTASLSATTPSSVTFKFTDAAGYSCNGQWYLWSQGTNSQVTSGTGSESGVTFTWTQMQGYEGSQGTVFDLVSGSPSSDGCTLVTSTLSVSWSPAIASVTCTVLNSGQGAFCPSSQTISQAETMTFQASCIYPCQFTGWQVNGVGAGTSTSLTLQLTTTQNWNVVAFGNTVTSTTTTTTTTGGQGGTCTLSPSTNAAIIVTVVNSQNSSAVVGASVVADGASAITDSNGIATICNIPVPNQIFSNHGDVTLSVSKVGFRPASQTVTITQGQFTNTTVNLSPAGISIGGLGPVSLIFLVSGAGLTFFGVTRKKRA